MEGIKSKYIQSTLSAVNRSFMDKRVYIALEVHPLGLPLHTHVAKHGPFQNGRYRTNLTLPGEELAIWGTTLPLVK
jgi:hypothetical protein